MAVALDAAVGDPRRVEQLGVDALVALTGALAARQTALGGAVVQAAVVLQLVHGPVVQPEGHVVLGAGGLGAALCDGVVDDLCDGRPCLVVDRGDRRSAQVPDVGLGVHEVEVDVVRARCGELEGEVITFSPQLVVVAPLGARGVADALGAAVGVPVRRYVHAGLCGGGAAGLRDVERGCGACGRVVPAHGEREPFCSAVAVWA